LPSEKHIAANKRNTVKSTGPRITEESAFANERAYPWFFIQGRFGEDFILRHLTMAATLYAELEPVRRQRIVLHAALDAAIAASKAAATKKLLRKLQSLERRERTIVRSKPLP